MNNFKNQEIEVLYDRTHYQWVEFWIKPYRGMSEKNTLKTLKEIYKLILSLNE